MNKDYYVCEVCNKSVARVKLHWWTYVKDKKAVCLECKFKGE